MFKKIKEFLFGKDTMHEEVVYKLEAPVLYEPITPEIVKKPRKPRAAKPKVEDSSTKTTATKKAPVAKITGAKRGPKPKTKE